MTERKACPNQDADTGLWCMKGWGHEPPHSAEVEWEDEHVPGIRPAQKMDLYQPAFAPTCSCGWDPGGVMSESKAWKSARQHADAKNQ